MIVFAVEPIVSRRNGPAVTGIAPSQPVLNTVGSLFVEAGYSGENSTFHSA